MVPLLGLLFLIITDVLLQPLFGHGTKDPVTYQQTSNGELFYIDDPEVNVVAIATTEESIPQLASPAVSGWFFLTGYWSHCHQRHLM